MIVAVKVDRVTLDTSSDRFVVILKDEIYKRWLPIVVGPAEAHAIAVQLEDMVLPRPMTHDLLRNILDSVNASVSQVTVNDLKDNTYYAVLNITHNDNTIIMDARPSDAIALALRTNSPIFVEEEVMKRASISSETDTPELSEEEELKSLNMLLQMAIREERYEDAARYRDAINELREKLDKENNDQQENE
ncbi:bifunctional nuclease family protein [bacterium]|nr:bifunctional nuclease family protein [bacterium]